MTRVEFCLGRILPSKLVLSVSISKPRKVSQLLTQYGFCHCMSVPRCIKSSIHEFLVHQDNHDACVLQNDSHSLVEIVKPTW